VARNLPGRFRPRAWQHVDALPKSALGKLERSRLNGLLCPDRMLTLD
jgi:acyl-coenzyme A synthetase/AMP-(fatty) acid ligase